MKVTKESLVETYSQKTTEELLSLYNSNRLTPEACDAIESVLTNRGDSLPERSFPSECGNRVESLNKWGSFAAWFLAAAVVFTVAHSMVNPLIYEISDGFIVFTVYFILLSIPFIIVWLIRGKKTTLPELLKRVLLWSIALNCIMLLGSVIGRLAASGVNP